MCLRQKHRSPALPVAAPAQSAAILPPRLRQTNEKAPAAVPRSQPNSLISGTISNENAVRAVTPIAIVTNATAMITQPK